MATVKPAALDYINQTVTLFTDGTVNTDWTSPASILGTCLLPPLVINETFYPEGLLVVAYLTRTGSLANNYVAETFDVSTGLRTSDLGFSVSIGSSTSGPAFAWVKSVPYPLGQGTPGYIFIYFTNDTGTLNWHASSVRPDGSAEIFVVSTADGQILTDLSPIPRASRPAFHLAQRQNTNDSSTIHLSFYFEEIDYATGDGTISLVWSKRYQTSSWTIDPAWTVEPTGVLCVCDPWNYYWNRSATFAVIGVVAWDSGLNIYTAVSPRLCVIDGGANGSGQIVGSTNDLSIGYATCMTYSENGYVFVGMNGSLYDDTKTDDAIEVWVTTRNGPLWNMIPAARYSLTDNGYSAAPQKMNWDGNRLIVYLLGTDRKVLTFDSGLNLLSDWTVPSQSQSGNNLSTNSWNAAGRSSQRFLGLNQ